MLTRLMSLLMACSCEQMHSQGSNPPSAISDQTWSLKMSVGILTKCYYFIYTCKGSECSPRHTLIPNQGQQDKAC